MPQHRNDPVERSQQRPEPRPDIERARDEPSEDMIGLEDDEDMDVDVDPDSAESENDRDDMLTE